jgi:hypothetical protein
MLASFCLTNTIVEYHYTHTHTHTYEQTASKKWCPGFMPVWRRTQTHVVVNSKRKKCEKGHKEKQAAILRAAIHRNTNEEK